MKAHRIRPISICLFRHNERILISEAYDSIKQDCFARPLGGGIEFGETSRAAVEREIREELGVAVEKLELIGVLENIFIYEGQQGHEIVFVYDAEFVDKTLYERTEIECCEAEINARFEAVWRTMAELAERNMRLVPEGLADMVKEKQ